MNETIQKFGYPDSVVHETEHWVLLLRAKQVTLGSLILASKGEHGSLSELSEDAFIDLGLVIKRLEPALRQVTQFEKINYLLLMMKDKHVHFHIFPRYSGERIFSGAAFPDLAWPGAPDTSKVTDVSEAVKAELQTAIQIALRDA